GSGPAQAGGPGRPHGFFPAAGPGAGAVRQELAELLFLQLTNTAMAGRQARTLGPVGGSGLPCWALWPGGWGRLSLWGARPAAATAAPRKTSPRGAAPPSAARAPGTR